MSGCHSRRCTSPLTLVVKLIWVIHVDSSLLLSYHVIESVHYPSLVVPFSPQHPGPYQINRFWAVLVRMVIYKISNPIGLRFPFINIPPTTRTTRISPHSIHPFVWQLWFGGVGQIYLRVGFSIHIKSPQSSDAILLIGCCT